MSDYKFESWTQCDFEEPLTPTDELDIITETQETSTMYFESQSMLKVPSYSNHDHFERKFSS